VFDVTVSDFELPPVLSDAEIEELTLSELDRIEVEDAAGDTRERLPGGMGEWSPGMLLAAVVSGVDRTALSGYDLVDLLTAESRLVSHFQARMYATMVEISHRTNAEFGISPEAHDEATDEIRAALTLTRRAAETEFNTAWDLIERLPQVGDALNTGDIDLRRARAISHQTGHLDQDTARQASDQILEHAPRLTSGQITARLANICISIDPDSARERYETGLEERRVWAETNPDGTANHLGLNLPPDRVYQATRRINQIARSLKTTDETRSIDQIRADIYLDLLCGTRTDQTSPSGHVDITVELNTLAGLDNHPGQLNGMGPVIADIARQVTAHQQDAQWSYTVTDQGQPIATGTTSRRPTQALQRHNQALYPTCTFPGCRMPARDCDIDHRQPRNQNGPTTLHNLAPLCRHDHQLKDTGNWTLTRNPDGTHTWTSPLGHHYTTGPDPP
jgi:hypothetical protein